MFSSVNTLKNMILLGLALMILYISMPEANAQSVSESNLNSKSASNSQQSQLVVQAAKTRQRTEIFNALSALNEKYKEITQRIPIVPLLKDPSKRFEDGEELIFSIIVDNLKLAELFGYKSNNGLRLSLAELTQALDFPISKNNELSEYTGWFIDEKNTFTLTMNSATAENSSRDNNTDDNTNLNINSNPNTNTNAVIVNVNGSEEVLDPKHYQIEPDDIYIDAQVMGQWFGINISYDFITLKIVMIPNRKLPIQSRLERQTRKVDPKNSRKMVQNPLKDNEYQALSPQTLDVVINASTNKQRASAGYSLLGVRDLAYMKSEFFALGNDQTPLVDARLKFSKSFNENQALNKFITQVQLGDISPIKTGTSATGELSRGLSFTNRPLSGSEDINVTSFKGDIQVGWDVELYRNNILLASKYDVADGRYDFNDIPLFFGNNIFEIVYYGPQGQIKREKIERVVSRTLQNKKGIYSFSFNQLGKTTFGLQDDNRDLADGYLASGSFERGVTDTFSLKLGLASQFGGDDDVNTASIGANMKVLDNVLLGTVLQASDNNTQALSGSARTTINDHAISTGFSVNKSIIPTTGEAFIGKQFRGEVSGGVELGNTLPPVSYQHTVLINDDFDSQSKQWTTGLSTRLFNTSINTGLSYIQTESPDLGKQSFQEASLNLQQSIGPVFINFQSIYDLSLGKIRTLGTQLNYNITNNIKSRLTYQHSLINNEDSYSADINWRHDDFSLSSKYQYTDNIGWNAGLFLRFGLGYIGQSQHFIVDRSSLAVKGSVLANVFLDKNFNGVFDENDERLPGVKLQAVQAYKKGITDEKGIALISGLPDNKITDIKVVRRSLPDPYMLNYQDEFSVRARAGFIEVIDIPIVQTSEIDGTVFLNNNIGNEIQLAYAPIHLMDLQGNVLQTVTSEFDGYYLFMNVLPGEYSISIDKDFILERNIKQPINIDVAISAQGMLNSGNDFRLAQLIYKTRFIVSLGQFSDSDVMQAFWNLVKQTQPELLSQSQPFFFKTDEISSQQYLGVALHVNKNQAIQACEVFSAAGISCDIIDYSVAFTSETVKGDNSET